MVGGVVDSTAREPGARASVLQGQALVPGNRSFEAHRNGVPVDE